MRRLVPLLTLAVLGSLLTVPSSAAGGGTVDPPGIYMRGNLGIYTTKSHVRLRLDRGSVNFPDAEGEENRKWDVQVLRTDMRTARRPAMRTFLTGTTDRHRQVVVGSGMILCVRARQHSWGLTSDWSRISCVVRARDDEDLRHHGPVRVVKDRHYSDGRAMLLPRGATARLPRVPKNARFGPVETNPGIRPDGSVCAGPLWGIDGHRASGSGSGVATSWLRLTMRRVPSAGAAVLRQPYGRRCPVGGFVVVPKWVR